MPETQGSALYDAFGWLMGRLGNIVQYPFQEGHRFFWLYLITSGLVAYLVYRRQSVKPDGGDQKQEGFWKFLFPKEVWSNPSAWLDLRFFLVNEVFGKLVYAGILASTMLGTFYLVVGGSEGAAIPDEQPLASFAGVAVSLGYMIVAAAISDFLAFYLHYLQHKVPLLWEFHKVHHSPEVMHPVSNFREHPIDNVAYGIGIGGGLGVFMGLASNLFGYIPTVPEIMGVPVLFFLFNIGAYHLRHSHVWLRWPGRWSMIFPSPAHHHVHHSCHPDHLDKNFAFMFPLWDVLFRTYHMPDDDQDVKFGIYGMEETEYTSVWKLYFIPFRNIYNRLKSGKSLTVNEEPHQDDA